MVQILENIRKSNKGHDLYTVLYLPDNNTAPKAVLCFHHGIQEHVGRYKDIFTTFADAGIAVVSGDVIGHGKSGGDRIYIDKFSDIVDELLALREWAAEELQKHEFVPAINTATLPYFVGGQSLGGLVAALAAERDQDRWAGLLMWSPATGVEFTPILRIQAAMGGLLSAVIPRARIVAAVDTKYLNRDPAKVKEYMEDVLNCTGPLPARTGMESMRAFQKLQAVAPTFKLPLYAHHGTADKVTSCASTKSFVDAAASPDKTFISIEGGYHEVLNEDQCSAELIKGIVDWILTRAAPGNAKL